MPNVWIQVRVLVIARAREPSGTWLRTDELQCIINKRRTEDIEAQRLNSNSLFGSLHKQLQYLSHLKANYEKMGTSFIFSVRYHRSLWASKGTDSWLWLQHNNGSFPQDFGDFTLRACEPLKICLCANWTCPYLSVTIHTHTVLMLLVEILKANLNWYYIRMDGCNDQFHWLIFNRILCMCAHTSARLCMISS